MIYLDQYRSNITGGIGNYINDVPSEYIEQVSDGKASKIIVNTTSLGGNNVSIDFQDSCVVLDSSLSFRRRHKGAVWIDRFSCFRIQKFSVIIIVF